MKEKGPQCDRLAVGPGRVGPVRVAGGASMDEVGAHDLTAVDILLSPDETMLALANGGNARMLTSVPSPPGFGLDQHHQPHITALQRYVRTADLDNVYV